MGTVGAYGTQFDLPQTQARGTGDRSDEVVLSGIGAERVRGLGDDGVRKFAQRMQIAVDSDDFVTVGRAATQAQKQVAQFGTGIEARERVEGVELLARDLRGLKSVPARRPSQDGGDVGQARHLTPARASIPIWDSPEVSQVHEHPRSQTVGYLSAVQEAHLARVVVLA